MTAAFTFPGQGSQAVGMGKALAEAFPAARAVFDEVDSALGEKLTAIIWDGPAETLQLTENAQPALMAVSIATLRVLETEAGFSVGRDAAFVAGHSLGEYSALAAAGSLSVSDTARLLRTRGLAMQKAVPVGAGAMAALLGLDAASYVPPAVSDLLIAHESATGIAHDFPTLSAEKSVQQILSTERHEATFAHLKATLSVRSHNLLLACSMPLVACATDPGPWSWPAVGCLPHGHEVPFGSASLS